MTITVSFNLLNINHQNTSKKKQILMLKIMFESKKITIQKKINYHNDTIFLLKTKDSMNT